MSSTTTPTIQEADLHDSNTDFDLAEARGSLEAVYSELAHAVMDADDEPMRASQLMLLHVAVDQALSAVLRCQAKHFANSTES